MPACGSEIWTNRSSGGTRNQRKKATRSPFISGIGGFRRGLFVRGVHDVLGSYADTVFHVEHRTVYRDSVQKRGGEVGIVKKPAPFVKPELGCDDRCLSPMSAPHEIEEQAHLFGLG